MTAQTPAQEPRKPHASAARLRDFSINALLLCVVLAATVPLCGYLAYVLYTHVRDAQAQAQEVAQSVASEAAAWTRRELRTTEHLLRELSRRPQVRALDRNACDPLLASLLPLLPQYSNISVVAEDGTFICSATPAAPTQRVPQHTALKAAFRGDFAVSEPLLGVLPRQFTVSAAYPVRADDGRIRAALTMPIELSQLQLSAEVASLPPRSRARLIDAQGTVLASSAAGDALGSNLFKTEIDAQSLDRRSGPVSGVDSRGIERLYAVALVGVNGWRTVADVSAGELLDAATGRMHWSIALGTAAFVIALLSGLSLARHIARPLSELERAMHMSTPGNYVRARVDGPREVRSAARRFNDMIDESLRAEASMSENETRLRLAVAAAEIGIWDWDIANSTMHLSPEWKRQLGYEAHELDDTLRAWEERLHPDERFALRAQLDALLEGPATGYTGEFRLRGKGGGYRVIECHAEIVRDAQGRALRMVGANLDVTQRRRMETELHDLVARLRELTFAVLEAEDRERRRISRELHDRVSGNLTAMQLAASGIGKAVEAGAADRLPQLLRDLRGLIVDTSTEIRTLMAELRPPALDDFGLAPALRSLATAATSRMGLQLVFHADAGLPRLRPTVETTFYRIAQEALTNIAKHANATRVTIALEAADEGVTLRIDDDGRGFDPAATGAGGEGLRNIRERADAVGAGLEIVSCPGRGTLVTVNARHA